MNLRLYQDKAFQWRQPWDFDHLAQGSNTLNHLLDARLHPITAIMIGLMLFLEIRVGKSGNCLGVGCGLSRAENEASKYKAQV